MPKRDLNVKIDGDPKGFIAAARASQGAAKRFSDELDRLNKKRALDSVTKGAADANRTFTDLFGTIGKMGPGSVALLAAAIAALPATAGVAAAGVTAALGGGLAAVGLVAAAQSSQVKREFSDLAADAKTELADIAEPLEGSLLRAAGVAREVGRDLAPDLEDAFAKLAPKIDGFVARVGAGAAENLGPALDPVAEGFGTLLDALASRSDVVFGNIGDAITELAETTEEHADDIASVVELLSSAGKGAADGVGRLADEWDGLLSGIEDWYESAGAVGPDLDSSGDAARRAAEGAFEAARAFAEAATGAGDAANDVDRLTTALERFFEPALAALSASNNWRDSLAETRRALKEGNVSALERSQLLERLLGDLANWASAEAEATGATKRSSAAFEANAAMLVRLAGSSKQGRAALDALAGGFGYTIERAKGATIVTDRFGNRVKVLPSGKVVKIEANTRAANNALNTTRTLLGRIQNKTVTITAVRRGDWSTPRNPGTSREFHGSTGGMVSGPGTSTSDSIPAWLSDGEFVVNARATARHRQLLEAINAGKFARGGLVRGYATGGLVSRVPISEFIDRWLGAAEGTTRSDVTEALRRRKDAVEQLRRAERKLREDRRENRSARTIADSEARVAKERRDLAAATDKLRTVEARYNRARLSPVAKLSAGLALGIKNMAAFIRNIKRIEERGYPELAQQLVAMGGPEAEKIAAEAAKLPDAKLRSLNKQVSTAARQQRTLDYLPQILAVREARRRGASNPAALAAATGMSEEEIAEVLRAMQGYARGGIERYAAGGRRPGPGITSRPTVLFGEGRHPEGFVPYDPAHRPRAMGLVAQMARDFGMTGGGHVTQVTNVHVTVQVAPTADRAAIGREINQALTEYARKGGRLVTAS
ncbi:SLT domain-containing protein [Thermocatellispora tengchongensis]|uniref:SLT domain-containing protein n=1 Tax=Thermocatellispora tengchongensis TaxID=1073253 RepID=A0A840NPS8_9ACTN|nr:hypothetical protein [Thermocatellispora tengchongensis]MBB5130544.1 SLT domain-containing protein [Thermocatellispora tengchongensis]